MTNVIVAGGLQLSMDFARFFEKSCWWRFEWKQKQILIRFAPSQRTTERNEKRR